MVIALNKLNEESFRASVSSYVLIVHVACHSQIFPFSLIISNSFIVFQYI